MNYNEFITISKESMNDITFDVYSKEIEPCYNWLPEVNSKKEFINWWKKNKKYGELCENFLDSFPDAYFLRSQPKRTTFHVPVFTNL